MAHVVKQFKARSLEMASGPMMDALPQTNMETHVVPF